MLGHTLSLAGQKKKASRIPPISGVNEISLYAHSYVLHNYCHILSVKHFSEPLIPAHCPPIITIIITVIITGILYSRIFQVPAFLLHCLCSSLNSCLIRVEMG